MKKKLILMSIFLVFAVLSFSQVTLKLGSIENAEPGTNIHVPLVVTGLSSTGQAFMGVELLFTFQESIITYDTLANGHPLTPINQWIAGSLPGKVSANWLEVNLQTINVDDNSTLIEFVFFYSGGQANLTFDQSATFVYDSNGNPIAISQFIDGTITQAQGSGNSVWNGTGSWAVASNWSNGIPGDSTDAVLNTGSIDLVSGGVCGNLAIYSGVNLIIQPGYSLTVNGDLTNDGDILINSDSLVQGSLIVRGIINQSGVSRMAMQLYNGISYQVSPPVQGATGELLTGLGTASSFNESTNSWNAITSSSALDPGIGFDLESSGNSSLYFNGKFNNSSLTLDLSFTSQGDINNEGWNFVGNPFTCSIDADNYLHSSNTDRAIYVWDGYHFRVWNGTAGSVPQGIIPPMTGFFVRANASNAQLTFDSEGEIHDFSHYGSPYAAPANVLKVNVTNFDTPLLTDAAFLEIEPSSTEGYDGAYDAFKLRNSEGYPEIYLHDAENNRLAISSIPVATEVSAGVRIPADGTYVISAETFSFLPDHPVYLIDQDLQITKDLRIEDYVFITTAGDLPERFKIIMTGLGTGDLQSEDNLLVYSSHGNIMIDPLKQTGKCRINVYDLSGRMTAQAEQYLEAGQLTSVRGVAGINIVSIQTESAIYRFKVFIR
jgi:hypothetical protein